MTVQLHATSHRIPRTTTTPVRTVSNTTGLRTGDVDLGLVSDCIVNGCVMAGTLLMVAWRATKHKHQKSLLVLSTSSTMSTTSC